MFVTNHVLSGVLIGRALKKRPGLALLAGVASHLVLDAIPHWGCNPGRAHFLTVAKRDGVHRTDGDGRRGTSPSNDLPGPPQWPP